MPRANLVFFILVIILLITVLYLANRISQIEKQTTDSNKNIIKESKTMETYATAIPKLKQM